MSRYNLVIASTSQEREACLEIRRRVFVEEQGLFVGSDVDRYDADAIHILAYADGTPAGTVRCYRQHGDIWYGGRLAVLPGFRLHLGAMLVRRAVETMEARSDVRRFFAIVQEQNVHFFCRLKWKPHGIPFRYDGVLHQLMEYPLHAAGNGIRPGRETGLR